MASGFRGQRPAIAKTGEYNRDIARPNQHGRRGDHVVVDVYYLFRIRLA
jgi:hypothetical protein